MKNLLKIYLLKPEFTMFEVTTIGALSAFTATGLIPPIAYIAVFGFIAVVKVFRGEE